MATSGLTRCFQGPREESCPSPDLSEPRPGAVLSIVRPVPPNPLLSCAPLPAPAPPTGVWFFHLALRTVVEKTVL